MKDDFPSIGGMGSQPGSNIPNRSAGCDEQKARPGVLLTIIGGGAGTLILLLLALVHGGGRPSVAKIASKDAGPAASAYKQSGTIASTTTGGSPAESPASATALQSTSARASKGGSWTSVEEKWGIQITGLRLAMGGAAVDLRYKVVDADKATGLMKLTDGPYVIDHTSGKTLAVPFQKENQTQQKLVSGKSYFALLPNEGAAVQPGHKVTVAIGSTLQSDLTIE